LAEVLVEHIRRKVDMRHQVESKNNPHKTAKPKIIISYLRSHEFENAPGKWIRNCARMEYFGGLFTTQKLLGYKWESRGSSSIKKLGIEYLIFDFG
jgi:hypothetical protein